MVFPSRFLAFMGWPYPEPTFFPSASGKYLIILGIAYFCSLKHRGMVRFTIFSKMTAVAFLLTHALFVSAPPVVFVTAALDGIMGLALWILYHLTNSSREAAAAPEG